MESIRLTTLSQGGGCGCKIAPAVLAELLQQVRAPHGFPQLLVGTETADDAAVYQLNESQALVATTDFFMPIVDDAFDFGRIAACNALSDIYAMGAVPLLALAIVGMPLKLLPAQVIRQILHGGEAMCALAGIPIAGGHSIDCAEPIYGLAVSGVVHPQELKRNCAGRAGDSLVLGKPLGVGILAAALKRGQLSANAYEALINVTTLLNRAGTELAGLQGVHAMTDVTGFGLLGHLLEMCRGAGLGAELRLGDIPLLPEVLALAEAGVVTGASARNWSSYADEVRATVPVTQAQYSLLCDPQTSGGLLVACARSAVPQVLDVLRRNGCLEAAAIGELRAGAAQVALAS
jgi:selenide, water dikinase